MRAGIVGSRRRNSMRERRQVLTLVERLLIEFPDLTLVSGGCRQGADAFADEAHRVFDVPMVTYLPDFSGSHRFAAEPFFVRNRRIAQDSDRIYAWVAADRTGGTENTVTHALELGRPVFLVDGGGNVYLSTDGEFPRCEPITRLSD
jgi:predicted Rossmann fold nucleotide-binding protein DprA/Smf involved in DNA uptake